jgi:hypothetical protein
VVFQRLDVQFIGFIISAGKCFNFQIIIDKGAGGNLADGEGKITIFQTSRSEFNPLRICIAFLVF